MTKPRHYTRMVDGEGISLPANAVFLFACCDCGLVHDVVVATRGKSDFGLAVRRNKRATAARRRWIERNRAKP